MGERVVMYSLESQFSEMPEYPSGGPSGWVLIIVMSMVLVVLLYRMIEWVHLPKVAC
jgi:hypothetical protein